MILLAHSEFILSLFSDPHIGTAMKINNYLLREEGWHYGEGVPASELTVVDALKILELYGTLLIDATDAFLGLDGEIRVTAYQDGIYIESTVHDENLVDLLIEQDDAPLVEKEALPISDVVEQIKRIANDLWNLSELSRKSIMTHAYEDFKVWRSSAAKAYRYSPLNVQSLNQEESVVTFHDSMSS